jgi:hypothetical protein
MLIGITGHAGSGKDTIGEHLVAAHDFRRISFAQPLRAALMAAFELDWTHFEGESKERPVSWIGRSPRQLMQTLGTEWGRQCVAQDIWLRVAERRIALGGGTSKVDWVITDVRFDNEAEFIRRLGGQVWRVLRPDAIPVSPHASEGGVALSLVDYTIENDASLDELRQAVDRKLARARAQERRLTA